nr:RHS repeat-associated core domain-containing protein [uncultured Chryseobacterium sp.]
MKIKSLKLPFKKKSALLVCFFAIMFLFSSFTKEDRQRFREWKKNWNRTKPENNHLSSDFPLLSHLADVSNSFTGIETDVIRDFDKVEADFNSMNINSNNHIISENVINEKLKFSALEREGLIGILTDEEEDRVKDNFFTVNITHAPDANSHIFLEYELFGLASHHSASRSVNHHLSMGGEIIIPSSGWSHQREEISSSILKNGINSILFTSPASGVKYKVRNLKISFEGKNLMDTGSDITSLLSGNMLYVKGLNNDTAYVNGKMVRSSAGEFEKLIQLSDAELKSGKFSVTRDNITKYYNVPDDKKSFKIINSNVYPYKTVDLLQGLQIDVNYEDMNVKADKETAESASVDILKLRAKDLPAVSGGLKNVTQNNSGYRLLRRGSLNKKLKISIPYDEKRLGLTSPKDIKVFSFDYDRKQWKIETSTIVDVKSKMVTFEGDGEGDYINGIISAPESPQLNAANPTGISGLKAGNPTAAISSIGGPVANHKGDANVSHPIVIPSGRRGMQPSLSIGYSSSAGNGWLGEGWDVNGISSISIDTRWGSPKFNPTYETELYSIDGEMLVYDGNYLPHRHNNINETSTVYTTNQQERSALLANDKKVFFLRKNHNFTKIERYGANPKLYRWIVTATNGTKTYYGGDESGVVDEAVIKDASDNIIKWSVLKIEDVYKNNIKFEYENFVLLNQSGDNENLNNGIFFHIKKILYTGKDGTDGNYSVNFERETSVQRQDISMQAKSGRKIVEPYRLENIVIKYDDEVIRRYNIQYTTGEFFKTLLNDIIEYDSADNFTNQHRFEYYNDLADSGANFGADINIDGGGGHDAFPLLPSGLKPSKIAANNMFEWGIHGRVPGVGLDILLPGPFRTYGHIMASFNIGHSEAEAKKSQELMDFDGDGIPDLIYRKRNTGLRFRPGNLSGSNISFGSDRNIENLNSNFSLTKTKTNNIGWDAGIRVFSLGFNYSQMWSTSKSDTQSFILDANSDGIMDVVKDGQVLFGRRNHSTGNVEMTQFSDTTENMVIVADALTQHNTPLEGQWQDVVSNDVVKVWVAPREGFVEFSDIVNIQNTSGAKADYSVEMLNPDDPTKNVRIYLKTLTAGMGSQNILISKYNDHFLAIQSLSPANPNNHLAINNGSYLRVKSGEKIFIRLHYNDNTNHKVFSNPKIRYVNTDISAAQMPFYQQDGYDMNSGYYSDNYFLNNHTKPMQIDAPGNVRISVPSVNFPFSTDDIKFKIIKTDPAGNETVLYNQTYPQSNTAFTTTPLANNIANVTNLNFGANDVPSVIRFVVETDSHTSFKDSNWNKISVSYTPVGSAQKLIYPVAEYPSFYITELNKQISVAESQSTPPAGIQEYKIELNKSNFSNAGLTKGTFYYIVKRGNQTLAKRRIINPMNSTTCVELDIISNQLVNGLSPISFFTGDAATAAPGDGRISVQVYCLSESDYKFYKEYSNLYQNKPFNLFYGTSNIVLGSVNHTSINSSALEKVGQFYHNWSQFLYNEYADVITSTNADGFILNPATPFDEYGRLINLASLKGVEPPISMNFPACENLPTQQETAECIVQQINNSGYYQNPANFNPEPIKPMDPYLISGRISVPGGGQGIGYFEKWIGVGPEQYSSADGFRDDESVSTFFNPQTANPDLPDTFVIQGNVDTKMYGINKKYYSKTRTNTLSGSLAGAGLSNVNSNLVGDGNITLQDFMDLNGDGYPDAVYKDAMQTTNATGGHRPIHGPLVNAYISNTNSYMNTTGAQFSTGTIAAAAAALKNGEIISSSSAYDYIPSDAMQSGTESNSSFSVSVNTNYDANDSGESFWLDINGDGMPDRVTGGGTSTMKFYLNLGNNLDGGHSFNNAETYSSGPVSSFGLGFNFDFSGLTSLPVNIGLSASYALGSSKSTFEDINGDGLIDILIIGSNQTSVKYNLGNKFSAPVVLSKTGGGIDYNNEAKTYRGGINIGGGYYKTIPIVWWPFFPIPIIYLKIGGEATANVGLSIAEVDKSFKDMNGDGFTDLVISQNDGFVVNYSKIGKTNKLKKVIRNAGIINDIRPTNIFVIDYEFNKPTYQDPNARLVMKEVNYLNPDAMSSSHLVSTSGKDMVTRFRYINSRYNRREREYFGFEKVISEQMNSATVYRRNEDTYNNSNYFLNGLVVRSEVYNGTGSNMLSRTINSYTLHKFVNNNTAIDLSSLPDTYDNGGTEGRKMAAVLLQRTNSRNYDNGGSVNTDVNFTYNTRQQLRNYKYVSPSSSYNSEITYHTLNNNILNVPKDIKVYSGSTTSTLMRQRACKVNQNTGDIESVSLWLNSGDAAIKNYKYDGYGNIIQVTNPPNANSQQYVLTYDYNTAPYKYPVRVGDSFGIESFAEYDPRFDVPTKTIDTGGNITEYSYDAKGRISSILAPYENGVSPYTVKYSYGFWDSLGSDNNTWTFPMIYYARTENFDPQNPSNPIETFSIVDGLGRTVQVKKDIEIAGLEKVSVSGMTMYDPLGRAVRQYHPVVEDKDSPVFSGCPNCSINPNLASYYTSTSYDVYDRPVTALDEDGYVTNMSYLIDNSTYKTTITQMQNATTQLQSESIKNAEGKTINTSSYIGGTAMQTMLTYNNIGELKTVTDPEGLITYYDYDLAGRKVSVNHPDRGVSEFTYDKSSNLIQINTANAAEIKYEFDQNRLTGVVFPDIPSGPNPSNVRYKYAPAGSGNNTGRIISKSDNSGETRFEYGMMGEVISENRMITGFQIPTMNFTTKFEYDSWNRVRSIVYPDGETLLYEYNLGGNLKRMVNNKNYEYVKNIEYDHYDQRTSILYGNDTRSDYTYLPTSRNLANHILKDNVNNQLLNNSYSYDYVDNITSVNNTAPKSPNDMAGAYQYLYQYDQMNRLSSANGALTSQPVNYAVSNASFSLEMSYHPSGSIQKKRQQHIQDSNVNPLNTYENIYHYTSGTHKVEVIEDSQTGNAESFVYDANGNIIEHQAPNNSIRMYWDESDRLKAYSASDTGVYQYYVYDDKGERAIKYDLQTGTQLYQNGALVDGNMILNDYKVYPNPYIVLTHASVYSKHYYAGSQRVASRLLDGAGQFVQQNRQPTKDKAIESVDAEADFYSYLKKAGLDTSKLESEYAKNQAAAVDVYYYHGDHIGSSTYITNSAAETTQFFLNLPFGETMAEQMTGAYDNPFKFNAKELDSETGLYYYGARYFNPRLSIWISVDPLGEKMPNWSPYVYTFNNPINLIDPDGKEPVPFFNQFVYGYKLKPTQWYATMQNYDPKSFHSAAAYSTRHLRADAFQSVYQRNKYYSWVQKQVDNKGLDSKWFGAAELVTGLNSVGGTELPNLWIIKDNTESFLKGGNAYLFKHNMKNARDLLDDGQMSSGFIDANGKVQSLHGLSGIALDQKMVEFEQSKVQEYINSYDGKDLPSIIGNINKLMTNPMGPSDVSDVMKESFNGGKSFDFKNYKDRVKLGHELIKKAHKK